jgi:hypothetical protein
LDAAFIHLIHPLGVDRIDFIKLDVEGAERLVWKGAHQFFQHHPQPLPLMHVEIGWAGNRKDWNEVVNELHFLAEHGYQLIDYKALRGTQNVFIRPKKL